MEEKRPVYAAYNRELEKFRKEALGYVFHYPKSPCPQTLPNNLIPQLLNYNLTSSQRPKVLADEFTGKGSRARRQRSCEGYY
jgi:hypothetical protein